MYERILNLSNIIDKKSLFLLGPRQTGKSTLIRQEKRFCPRRRNQLGGAVKAALVAMLISNYRTLQTV